MRWQAQAACRDENPEMFIPENGRPPPEAFDCCARCQVRSECAKAGEGQPGLWGGVYRSEKSARQRQREFRCEKCLGLFVRTDGGVERRCDSCKTAAELRRRRDRERQRKVRAEARIGDESGGRAVDAADPLPDHPLGGVEMAEGSGG